VITRSTFTENHNNDSDSKSFILLAKGKNVNISDCAFTNNTSKADENPYIIVPDAPGTATPPPTIALSVTGGGTSCVVSNCTFEDNSIGAMHLEECNIRGSYFRNNTAKQGGAIKAIGNVTIDSCTMLDNTATITGGAIYHTGTNGG
jgi:predicted outer membrane repeat protein